MKAVVLGSGSKGNSTLIMTDKHNILIDVGFSYPKMKMYLNKYNLVPSDIDTILITHTHSDHVNGLKTFTSKNNPNIYTNSKMYKELSKYVCNDNLIICDDDCYDIDGINVQVIHTSHDAVGSVGFIITNNDSSIVYITDTGYINKKYMDKLANKNIYILESNHDIEMLMTGPYPEILKRRVVGDSGHLSNESAGLYLKELIGCNTKKIVLAHLSEINNREDIALKTVLDIINNSDVSLIAARQNEMVDIGEF